MTREEEINIAVSRYIEKNSISAISSNKDSFIEGAKWSDEHPKSPWISVEDDLPCNHDKLINGNVTYPVFVRDINNIYGVTIMMKFIKWDFMSCNITHWMPIPKLPK